MLQLIETEKYSSVTESRLTKTIPQKAPRGEILDRYGRPLVSNRMGYAIEIKKYAESDEELNDILLNLIHICEEESVEYNDSLPITLEEPFVFDFVSDEGVINKKIAEFNKSINMPESSTAEEVLNELCEKYSIDRSYTPETVRKLAGVRAEMETRLFSKQTPYVFAPDVNMNVVTKVKETYNNYKGVNIVSGYIREYNYPGIASHILGHMGPLYKEDYEVLKEKGYTFNDVMGKSGIEQICESNLRGTDGTYHIEEDEYGHIVSMKSGTAAVPGNDVVLTIDLDLQQTAEQSLNELITQTRLLAIQGELNEKTDCNSGAVVVTDIHNGEVLALASNPTFNLQRFNEDYQSNYENPYQPMWNRAISGAYEPGSTFKIITAIGALEEGIIDTETEIYCGGKYTYFKDSGYTPSCNVKSGHGTMNVISAIEQSCNVFFFDTGRQLNIENLNKYTKNFGLGEPTGIELAGETAGIVANPEYRKKIGGEWYPGDVIQAAIGQSDNLFTPLQMANYVATLANGGTRYQPHLIKKIKEYSTSNIIEEKAPVIVDKVSMKPETYSAVMQGMKSVTEDGTASATFKDFDISVGGKTGTAEVSKGTPNAVFVAFAPFENPQIAISIIVEHGGHGNEVAPIARDIISKYFKGDFLEYTDKNKQMSLIH
ncbi:MAG: penicillin-binding protein 2 [Clostridia bacterium]|nr:penicillin-binding protein 2 [Clostridia bacterium]